jgi:hypothetical protein
LRARSSRKEGLFIQARKPQCKPVSAIHPAASGLAARLASL